MSPSVRSFSRLAPLLLALSGWACGGADAPAEASLDALDAPGPYAVGYKLYPVSYMPPLAAEARHISVHVWYPAQAGEGERPIYTLRKSEVAVTDAVPLELGARPVLAFSHGHQAYAAVMSYLMEHVASHGYVAIAPTHTGNSFLDGPDRTTDIYYLRSLDVKAALDFMIGLEDDPLAGKVSDRIVMSGHSFGGYTAMAVGGAQYPVDELDQGCAAGTISMGYCSTLTPDKKALFAAGFRDPRVQALISLDPGDFDLFGVVGVAQVQLPVLHMVAEASGNPPAMPSADAYWNALHGGSDLRLLLLGGDHNDFTDSCSTGLDIRCSSLPPREVWRPVRIYVLAFLDQLFSGREDVSTILNGQRTVSPLFEPSTR